MSEPNAIPTHRAHEDAELTEAQLQELAGNLTRKRKEVSERIRSLEQQIAVRDDCSVTDAADAASPVAGAADDDDVARKAEIVKKREEIARMGAMIAAVGELRQASGGSAGEGPGAALAAMLSQRGTEMGGSITSAESVRAHLAQLGMKLPQPPGRKVEDGT